MRFEHSFCRLCYFFLFKPDHIFPQQIHSHDFAFSCCEHEDVYCVCKHVQLVCHVLHTQTLIKNIRHSLLFISGKECVEPYRIHLVCPSLVFLNFFESFVALYLLKLHFLQVKKAFDAVQCYFSLGFFSNLYLENAPELMFLEYLMNHNYNYALF